MKFFLPLGGLSLALASCTAPEQSLAPAIPGPASTVTRSEAIAIVQAYADTAWKAEHRHQFHGDDGARVRVHTPDADQGTGWWRIDQVNVGMPYKWGGFDTPRSFLTGLKGGKFAGDISTPYKRRNLEAAVSREAVGIDCSGLVSRAWRLSRPYSTRDLPRLCDTLSSWEELRPGDILNRRNRHVILFHEWQHRGATFYAFEAGPYSGWRVTRNVVDARYLQRHGYVALRYRNMRDKKAGPLRILSSSPGEPDRGVLRIERVRPRGANPARPRRGIDKPH